MKKIPKTVVEWLRGAIQTPLMWIQPDPITHRHWQSVTMKSMQFNREDGSLTVKTDSKTSPEVRLSLTGRMCAPALSPSQSESREEPKIVGELVYGDLIDRLCVLAVLPRNDRDPDSEALVLLLDMSDASYKWMQGSLDSTIEDLREPSQYVVGNHQGSRTQIPYKSVKNGFEVRIVSNDGVPGRWPKSVPVYSRSPEPGSVMRPPMRRDYDSISAYRAEWELWRPTGPMVHPMDQFNRNGVREDE